MSSTARRVKNALAFLGDRGYRMVSESDTGMGGGVTYRSNDVWVAVEWDRDRQLRLEFASTDRSWYGRVPWDNIDHLLRGAARFERDPPLFRSLPLDELATFVRANLSDIERRFSDEQREATAAFLQTLEADRRRRADEYWTRLASTRGSSD